ncbi:RIP metalloprotease RseP [Orenia metallireducens]|uniref:Zinc metalloprotease n=1 Tax=Orenia metallireducens TaxID=1413210 RepID=A0A1C0AA04_9FIRM|nr:RIP metalloprotease RseP [Orenia metallireducens]OCL27124.1 RIP metalloprotease RseP [Orenia metallireducens]
MLTTLVSFIIVLGILVFFHELGHFMVAKYVGVQVEEFAIGMGPKLLGKQYGETLYSIRLLPLGGYCKMTGEMPVDDNGDDIKQEEVELYQKAFREEKCLFQKSVWQRFWVIFMGPVMNFLLAALFFTLIFSIYGVEVNTSESTVIGQVFPEQPAYEAGLRDGDKILAVNNQKVGNWEELAGIINKNPNQEIALQVERDNQILELNVVPRLDEDREVGVIGIIPVYNRKSVNIFEAIWLGIQRTGIYIYGLILGLWKMVTGQMASDVSGPVKIAQFVGDAARSGMLRLMEFSALISINLGIMNLLPIPALDGGRLVFLGWELITGKPVDPEKEGMVHLVGFVLLMVLFVVIMIKDIRSII